MLSLHVKVIIKILHKDFFLVISIIIHSYDTGCTPKGRNLQLYISKRLIFDRSPRIFPVTSALQEERKRERKRGRERERENYLILFADLVPEKGQLRSLRVSADSSRK